MFFQSVSTLRAAFPSVDYSQLYGASYLCCHRIPSCDRKQVLLARLISGYFWGFFGDVFTKSGVALFYPPKPRQSALAIPGSDYPRAAVLNIFLCHC